MFSDEFELDSALVQALENMGYRHPRPIQERAIAPILAGRDVIGLAQTGTGKTAAFGVPIAQRLLAANSDLAGIDTASQLRALVLCPTRELARQVADEISAITKQTCLRTACVYGKTGIKPQAELIARGLDILVGTPGRILDLLEDESLSLAYVRHAVIDEADRMMDMGFLPQVRRILAQVPEPRQTMLFTATMPQEVEELARRFLNEPERIEVGRHTTPVEHVEQHLIPVENRNKVDLLIEMLTKPVKRGVLIFCRTKRRVGWVGTALARNGIAVGMIHGDRSQAQRLRALDKFAAGEWNVLVATDVAARGLHIPAVRMVINYDLPLAPEEYVHRIGRAAHGGTGAGESLTLLARDDRERWNRIEEVVGIDLEPEFVPGFEPVDGLHIAGPGPSSRPRKGGKTGQRPGRSRKSRPIAKGEKPGRGVVRLKPPEESGPPTTSD